MRIQRLRGKQHGGKTQRINISKITLHERLKFTFMFKLKRGDNRK